MIDQLRAAAEALDQGDPEPFALLFAEDAEWRGVSHGHLGWSAHLPDAAPTRPVRSYNSRFRNGASGG
jgi:hypothetical protein